MQETQPISAEHMAALIIDALVDAGMIARSDTEAAMSVAAEEIRVRQALGNFIPAIPA